MTDERELLEECPFCRSSDHLTIKQEGGRNYRVNCDALDGGCGASNGWRGTKEEAVKDWNGHKRTCKFDGEWEMVSRTQAVRHDTCSNCGHEFGISRRDYFPFEMERLVEVPSFCPHCGSEVVDDDKR